MPLEDGRSEDTIAERDSRATILICEDEATLRELVQAVLGPEYHYIEAVDGMEALELTRAEKPHLIVLDLMLPEMSGFEVLDAMREDPALSEIPVVVLTAWSHVRAEAEEKGADRFIAKPFEPAELETAVRELLATP
jgi:CheY-like chemotaxis protein